MRKIVSYVFVGGFRGNWSTRRQAGTAHLGEQKVVRVGECVVTIVCLLGTGVEAIESGKLCLRFRN